MKTQTDILRWLRANLGKHSTGGLTSHDTQALTASVALVPMISYPSASPDLFQAYHAIVSEMQFHTRHLAFHAIAYELDWTHRQMIWTQSGMAETHPDIHTRCQGEPDQARH